MGDQRKEMLGGLLLKGVQTKESSFTPDSQETLEQKGDVYFIMGLSMNTDPNVIREVIKRETDAIGFCNYLHKASALICRTDPDTCEQYFNWRLRCRPEAKEKGMTQEGYVELQPAIIPIDLEGLVHSIDLNRQLLIHKE